MNEIARAAKALKTEKIFLLLVLLSSVKIYAHSGTDYVAGSWQNEVLVLKAKSNWGVERCFELESGIHIEYKLTVAKPVKFDFHVHPKLENNEYSTTHFAKDNEMTTTKGDHVTKVAGTYCFNINKLMPLKKNVDINFKYKVEPATVK